MSNNLDTQFQLLYEQHQPMVRQLTLGFVKGNHAQANDLCQEVFINVWRALSKFSHQSSHRTWIYRITVNTCLKSLRTQKGDAHLASIDDETLSAPSAPSALTSDENAEHLYRAIGQLEQLDRLVIMMVLDELPYPDIAQVLGVSEGALRVRIHRTKKQLQELLRHEH